MPSPSATTYQPVSRAEMISWFAEWPQRIGHLFEMVKLDRLIEVECLGCYEKLLPRAHSRTQKWVGMTIAEAMEFDQQWEFSIFLNGSKMPNTRTFELFGIFQPEFGWFSAAPPPDNYEMIGLTSKKQWVKVSVKSQNADGIQLPTEIRIENIRVHDFVQNYHDAKTLAHDFIARIGIWSMSDSNI